jgi:nitrite reductase (NADH) small subunit
MTATTHQAGTVGRGVVTPDSTDLPALDRRIAQWESICRFDALIPERGVATLVSGLQLAVFRTFEGMVYALGNQDPVTGAFVLSRGIVGTRGSVPTVASPLHKQVFDLRTGQCLDDDAWRVPVYAVRTRGGVVEAFVPSPVSAA